MAHVPILCSLLLKELFRILIIICLFPSKFEIQLLFFFATAPLWKSLHLVHMQGSQLFLCLNYVLEDRTTICMFYTMKG